MQSKSFLTASETETASEVLMRGGSDNESDTVIIEKISTKQMHPNYDIWFARFLMQVLSSSVNNLV